MIPIKKYFSNATATSNDEDIPFFIELLETLATSFVVLMVIYWSVAVPEVVIGASMEPTFYTGERILVEKVTKHFKNYVRGDIVVLNPPGNDHIEYVKRIVGVPGDVIKIYECNVYIAQGPDRYVLEESYLSSDTCTIEGPEITEGRSIRIPESYYLVLGDNRLQSADSRSFGLIEEKRIVGKVVMRFWPFDKMDMF